MTKPAAKQLDSALVNSTSHASIDHSALPGVLSPTAHGSLDHSSIPGVGGYGAIVWFATGAILASQFLAPFGVDNLGAPGINYRIRAPKAGTLTTAAFNGDTSAVDFIISAGGNTFNTGFVVDGAVVSPNLVVAAGDIIRVQINSVGGGNHAAWTLVIE